MTGPSTQSVHSFQQWDPYDDPLYRVIAGFNIFLKGLFSVNDPGNYRWINDLKATEIVITDQQPVNLEVLEKRPAIVTIRGPAQWANVGRNQFLDYEWATARETKMDIVSFTLTLACISREGIEAQRLAWFLFSMIPLFKARLQRNISCLHDVGTRIALTGETAAGSLIDAGPIPEWKMVQVVLPIQVTYKSSIEPIDKTYLDRVDAATGIIGRENFNASIHNEDRSIDQQARID